MKKFSYDKLMYFFDVIVTGLFLCFLFITALIFIVIKSHIALMSGVALISFYAIWNFFVAKSTPSSVVLDKEKIIFKSLNKKFVYKIDQIKSFKIREFPSAGMIYLRINGGKLYKDRFWVQTRNFENGEELFTLLLEIEYQKHPDTLKAKAKRVNSRFNKIKNT